MREEIGARDEVTRASFGGFPRGFKAFSRELPQLLNKAPRPPRRTVDALGELISRSNQHRGAQGSREEHDSSIGVAQQLGSPTPGQSDQHDADCQAMAVGASESPGCPCVEHSPAKASPAAAGPVGGQRATPTGCSGPA